MPFPPYGCGPRKQKNPGWSTTESPRSTSLPAAGLSARKKLQRFVRWVLLGQLSPCRSLPRYRKVPRVVDKQHWILRRDRWWTSRQSSSAQNKHEQMRQRQEKAKEEAEARKKGKEAEAERRRKRLEEEDRLRRAEEAARRRKVQEEEHRVRMEQWRQQRAEEEARRARERAEQEEKERQAAETAKAWWGRLSRKQMEELFAAVAERAWREEQLRVEIPENPAMAAHFAYGVPVYSRDRSQSLYGIVRPCPKLVSVSPQLSSQRFLMRNAQEMKEFDETLTGRITHYDLPEHEQLSMY